MTDALFAAAHLDDGGVRAGYRLQHVEVYNWGTFDKRVWRLNVDGETALLTGDIGSGKSTLVDAITTLLMPAHRISYNKAAGADAKERSLRSYVEGHYKSERVEASGSSRPVGLRDHRSYSVILGVFGNEGYDETVTLAQVFHQRDRSGQPDRFFVTAEKALAVEADFTDFGSDLNDLRRRLRASGAEIHTGFTEYARRVRKLLGIRSEQAMELFHQTVSMKSVGNLNEFVRNHMLEPADATERVKAIVGHFEDLTKAHDAVKRAREQLEALTPLVDLTVRYDDALARRAVAEAERAAIRLFVAETRIGLLAGEIGKHEAICEHRAREADAAQVQLGRTAAERDALIADRAAAGGDRVRTLEQEADTARGQVVVRRQRRGDFDIAVRAAGLPEVADEAAFAGLVEAVTAATADAQQRLTEVTAEHNAAAEQRGELHRLGEQTRAELLSLRGRTSNLPSGQVQIRQALCDELGLDASQLPFAGELLDVDDAHAAWRGAAERVLRSFALSLLVTQRLYPDVANWVNRNRLTFRRTDGRLAGSRLVYERVPERRVPVQRRTVPGVLQLADTLAIAESPLRDYLHAELGRRADHRCVDTVEQFRDEHRAVTREGQVRSGDRHEKDDRSAVDDPRTWVLGWSNQRKIDALTEQMLAQQAELLTIEQRRDLLAAERDELGRRLAALGQLATFRSWAEVDWGEAQSRAESAERERQRLVDGDSALAAIEERLRANADATATISARLSELRSAIAVEQDRLARAAEHRRVAEEFVDAHDEQARTTARSAYPALSDRLGDRAPTTSQGCDAAAATLTDHVQTVIDRANTEANRLGTQLVQQMANVRRRWPNETTEMDAGVEARAEYVSFHARVATDDLPRFETEFKLQLNTNTIRELAQFNQWLRRQSDEIHERVARINEALGLIDYSAGRYITLVAERTVNQEVQDFRADLRTATDDTLSADGDHYSEQRFLDVQRIIERFRGRDGHADTDRLWTRRVTDVRNWFTFSASERDRVTHEEWEHYRDSDGKSGGQKEKLAYTILAASLAYQFGLEWGVERSRDFRFAVIDEAFGRGSDPSTRYALELFAQLRLQLLVVTPLTKVHVIEPYVRAIGFVDNPSGGYSRLQTLTIEQFRAQAGSAQA